MGQKIVVLFFVFLFLSCSKSDKKVDPTSAEPTTEQQATSDVDSFLEQNRDIKKSQLTPEQWEKLRWVAKAMIILRGGQGLKPHEDLEFYLSRTKSEIIDELMKDKRFFETLVNFNYFFLGVHNDTVFEGGDIFSVVQISQATHAAKSVFEGGEFFEPFFNPHPPLAFLELINVQAFTPEELLTGREAVEYIEQSNKEGIQSIRDFLNESEEPLDMKVFCDSVFNMGTFGLGIPFHTDFADQMYRSIYDGCNAFNPELPIEQKTKAELLARVATYEKTVNKMIAFSKEHLDKEVIREPESIKALDLGEFLPGYKSNYFAGHAFTLVNSSTNFNRKRAAYVLDRFLCDNLLPIDVELPDKHVSDAHGREASCYACHYRLDPMAGFFKDYGNYFNSYASKQDIIFDDFVRANREEYQQTWLNADQNIRKWNIGIIRSEKDESKNRYGESLEDLVAMLKDMPEVKRCLVKRAFEYTTSVDQNVDQGYIEEVFNEFDKKAKEHSGEALKELFKTLLLNRSFVQEDPISTQCYDFPKGHQPDGAPPCEVNFILQKRCASCHSSRSPSQGLDLTTWKQIDGEAYGFDHKPLGLQLPALESFQRILEALTTTNPRKRMPYRQHMDPTEREALYLWVNKQIGG